MFSHGSNTREIFDRYKLIKLSISQDHPVQPRTPVFEDAPLPPVPLESPKVKLDVPTQVSTTVSGINPPSGSKCAPPETYREAAIPQGGQQFAQQTSAPNFTRPQFDRKQPQVIHLPANTLCGHVQSPVSSLQGYQVFMESYNDVLAIKKSSNITLYFYYRRFTVSLSDSIEFTFRDFDQ